MAKTNGALKIESGIPIPLVHKRSGFTDVIRSLDRTQSVLLPNATIQSVHSLIAQMCRHADAKGRVFTSRTIKGEGVRVWRIK